MSVTYVVGPRNKGRRQTYIRFRRIVGLKVKEEDSKKSNTAASCDRLNTKDSQFKETDETVSDSTPWTPSTHSRSQYGSGLDYFVGPTSEK